MHAKIETPFARHYAMVRGMSMRGDAKDVKERNLTPFLVRSACRRALCNICSKEVAVLEAKVKLLSSSSNAAVVQLLGRRYPSICLQGDTLNNLANRVHRMARMLLANKDVPDELKEDAIRANNTLVGLVHEYARIIGSTPGYEDRPYLLPTDLDYLDEEEA